MSSKNNSNSNPISLGNAESRASCNEKKVRNKAKDWSHKQQCFKRTIDKLLNKNNNSNPNSLGNAEFRAEFKAFCNEKKVGNKAKDWSHKQQCLKHTIAKILNKYFDLPPKLTNFCTCPETKIMVRSNFTKTHRINLLKALQSYTYKCKAAKLGIIIFKI